MFFQKDPAPKFQKFDWPRFLRLARLLTSAGHENASNLHPVLKAVLVYIKNCDGLDDSIRPAGSADAAPNWKEPLNMQ